MVIVGMDPSYKALSMSILDTDKRVVHIHTISENLGEGIGFEKIFNTARTLRDSQIEYIDSLVKSESISPITEIFSEIPPPTSAFSSGLFALDTLLLSTLFDRYTSIKKMYAIPPSYISTIHGTNKYNKSQSTQLAKYYLEEVLQNEFEVVMPDTVSQTGRHTKGKMNNDKAESFLFLLRAIVKYDIFNLAKKISVEMEGFLHKSEKLLVERT